MSATQKIQGHSANVRMHLRVDGHTFLIGHLGPGFVILDNPADLPPAPAEITMSIDGRVKRWPVHLPDGVSASHPRTKTQSSDH
jgi:hypothetical protein